MSNIKSKQRSSKKKTIIIVSFVLVVLIGLGAGLGVAFGGTSGKTSDTIKTTDPNTNDNTTTPTEGAYWKATTEKNSADSTKQLKTLRITKKAITEQHLKDAYVEMVSKKIDVSSFNELLLPYHFRDVVTEDKAKEILHVNTLTKGQFGYIFHKEDYKSQTIFGKKSIVELSLPEDVKALTDFQFSNNEIRKVNWAELTKLKSIGTNTFIKNRLSGNLNLSKLTSLTSIGVASFVGNTLDGTLTLPPNITTIGENAFNVSLITDRVNWKIKGTLKLPRTLISIGPSAFFFNSIEVLDWSEAESLKTISYDAFNGNRLKTLDFNANTLPKIETIGVGAFSANQGEDGTGELITKDITLPKNLTTIGNSAIKVKNGITITVSTNTTGVNASSFIGKPIIKTSTSTTTSS